MKGLFTRLGDYFEAIPDFTLKYRRLLWAGFILLIVLAVPGVMMFKMDLSDEQFFHSSDEVRQAYDAFRAQFGGDDSVYLVYRAKDGDVFSHASLQAVHDLQEELSSYRLRLQPGEHSPLDHMVDITSLINVSYLEPSEKALISRPFVGNSIPSDPVALKKLRETALSHPDYPLLYVAKNGEYAALLIRTDFRVEKPKENAFANADTFDVTSVVSSDVSTQERELSSASPSFEEYTNFYHAIEAVMQKPAYAAALEYFPVGGAPINAYINDVMLPQINFWTMMSVVLIAVIMWVLFRSLSALVWPILIIALSALLTVAVLGYFDIRMNMMINIVVLLILAIGVADAIHILSGYVYFRKQGHSHIEAMRTTYRKTGLGVTLTSLTTAVGMLSLLFVPLIPIQLFGLASALGVVFAFIISVLMLPLMLNLWAPISKKHEGVQEVHLVQRLLRSVEHLSHRYPKQNIIVFSIITLVLLYGSLQVRVDTNFMELFREGTPMRVAQETVEKNMGGTMALEVMLRSQHDEAMLKPEMLNTIDTLQHWLETNMGDVVVKTHSLVNIVKDSNRSLNGGKQEFYSIPQDPLLLRQTLFMFSNANPRDRGMLVSDDYRKTHVTVVFRNLGTRDYMVLLGKINHHIEETFAPLVQADPTLTITPTGSMVVAIRVIDYLSWSQIKGFGVALLSISIILFLTFRSFRVGLIALFPNLLPIVTVFGIMGFTGIKLDTDTLLVAPILIGIVVDDTIHFLTHYRAIMEEHDDIDRAIVRTFREVGQAIVFTSVILTGTFICFAFLDHNGLRNFGMLASLAMLTALAGDLLLLPALLKVTKTRFTKAQAVTTTH